MTEGERRFNMAVDLSRYLGVYSLLKPVHIIMKACRPYDCIADDGLRVNQMEKVGFSIFAFVFFYDKKQESYKICLV